MVKNPISRHLPPGCKVYGMSVTGNLYNPMALACALPEDKPVVFVIGAMAAGHITVTEHPYVRNRVDDGNQWPPACWGIHSCVYDEPPIIYHMSRKHANRSRR